MKYFGWIFLFFIMTYIVPLGSRPMLNPYEFRNAEIVEEMLCGNSMTSSARQDMICQEKLPMHHWLTGAAFKLFGHNSFANRLPSALAAGFTALLTALLIQQALRNEKLAALAAMIYMSCALVYLSGTVSGGANIFSMFTTGTLGFLFLAMHEEKLSRRKFLLMALAGIFSGAGFLAGGFAAVTIPAMVAAVYITVNRKWKEILLLPVPVLLFAVLTILPWALAINKLNADFWYCITVTDRLSGVLAWGNVPWWFTPALFAAGLLPAGLFIPAALFSGKENWKHIIATDIFRFSICVLFTLLVYFSVFGKHPAGILLCFPPAAIIIAAGLQAYFNSGGHHRAYNWVMSVWGIIMLLAGIAGIAAWFTRHCIESYTGSIGTLFITGGFAAFFCGVLMLYSLRGFWRIRMYLFFFGLALLPLGISWNMPRITPLMPECFIKNFAALNNVIQNQTVIAADAQFKDAAAWSLKKQNIATPEEAQKLLAVPDRQLPVLFISSGSKLNGNPAHVKTVTSNFCGTLSKISCSYYPPVKK